MNRRDFLAYCTAAGTYAAIKSVPFTQVAGARGVNLPDMQLHWQNLKTRRPWAPDYDDEGFLWFGRDKFFRYNPRTFGSEEVDSSFLNGNEYSQCLCQGDKVYILTQKSPFIYIYNQLKHEYTKAPLPDSECNIWYGTRVPGDPRLYLYARNRSKLVVWDTEKDKGKEIPYPADMDLWSGFYIAADEAIYSFTLDAKPCRLVRFDLTKQEYDAVIPAPDPSCVITGVNPVGNSVYCADRFTGRIIPFDFVKRRWSDPIHAPGFRTSYGFVGLGTTFEGKAYYCLSTYIGAMQWDFKENKYIPKKGDAIGVDGQNHHFLNKLLVYDPKAEEFSFLEADSPGKYPLMCYSIVCGGRLIITGFNLGDPSKPFPPMEETQGDLLIFQSV